MQNQAPLYCSCRSADINRFMIMCDKCGEWFHGDCIGMKEKDSKLIKKWFCVVCIKDYGLKIEYKNSNNSMKKKKTKKLKLFNKSGDDELCENVRCGQCSNCLQNEECGNKNFKFPEKHYGDFKKSKAALNSRNNNQPSKDIQIGGCKDKRFNYSKNPFKTLSPCFGPGCYKRARVGSKYCGDECGLALAKLRLVTILPQRLAERDRIPCKADQLDRARLENIRLQQKITAEKLKKIDVKELELHKLIESVKKLPIVDNNSNVVIQNDAKMYCNLCGWEIPLKSAGRHMELCFKKMEGQFKLVVSHEANKTSSKIFCDFYDAKNKTYCKYLRSICPDHVKPRKVSENEVCGCPIVKTISLDMFSNTDSFCQESKKKCDLHFNWENTALAEIDFEHLKEINKMNQLVGEEGIILQRLTNRLGALGILLNSTTDNSCDKTSC